MEEYNDAETLSQAGVLRRLEETHCVVLRNYFDTNESESFPAFVDGNHRFKSLVPPPPAQSKLACTTTIANSREFKGLNWTRQRQRRFLGEFWFIPFTIEGAGRRLQGIPQSLAPYIRKMMALNPEQHYNLGWIQVRTPKSN